MHVAIGTPGLESVRMIFAGTSSPKYAQDPQGAYGWGTLIEKNRFVHDMTIQLPTMWTLSDADDSTPYVFARSQ